MKVVNDRWSVNTRDFKHGKYCLNHCLHFAAALAAGLDEALDIEEKFPNDPKNLLEMEKGNDYEEVVLAQIKASLPEGDFGQIADGSNSSDTRMALLNRTPVIAQAPLSKSFGNIDFRGRADLLIREDYAITFTSDGNFAVHHVGDDDTATRYTVWDIKHSEGKKKASMADYEMQVAMMAEGLAELDLLSTKTGGLVMRSGIVVELNIEAALVQLDSYRAETLAFLESRSPQAEHHLAEFERFCQPKSKCQSAGCDFPDMCAHFRKETDSSSFLRSDSYTHFEKLGAAGLSTITEIAAIDPERDFGFDKKFLARYVAQSRAILKSRESGKPEFIVVDNATTCEAPIVSQSTHDLYLDFEYITPVNSSDTHYFLGGFVDSKGDYQAFASWDAESEREEMSRMVDAMHEHLETHPQALVYHYSDPEVTGVKVLGDRHNISDKTGMILGRMVDLQKTVKACVATSQNGIGLKAMAAFFDTKGYGSDVSSGDDASLKFYEAQKLKAKGLDAEAEAILVTISKYHEHDCELTLLLHVWLLEHTA